MLGPEKIIGISASSLSQAKKAEKDGADYIGLWPIFETAIKPQAKPVGVKLLGEVVKKVSVPVVALGGIDESNIDRVLKYTKRIAVIRAVLGRKNMGQAIHKLRRIISL
jgi:thiamine-phosphate pyrophosphorylase